MKNLGNGCILCERGIVFVHIYVTVRGVLECMFNSSCFILRMVRLSVGEDLKS